MTDIITFIGVLFLGGLAIFFIMTLLRICKSGSQMVDTVMKSDFSFNTWLHGSLPNPGYHPTFQTTSGIRARVGRKGLTITPTRTLSRNEF
jgi:hypothetical protein